VPFERELARVLGWLEETDRIAMATFGGRVPVEPKADGTPVTAADRAIERALRAAVARDFPRDAVLGEEEGGAVPSRGRRWILDPIDGTRNYARGVPVFGTLVALEDDDGLALGVVSAPALRARWWATRGGGAFRDGAPIRVSAVDRLAEAYLATGGLDPAEAGDRAEALLRLAGRVARHRGFGDFFGHVLVAQGSVDAMVEAADLALWDVAAPRIVVEEAGGRWTSLAGEAELRPGPAVSSNGLLHRDLLAVLAA
jgi:histidinol-phosphatase